MRPGSITGSNKARLNGDPEVELLLSHGVPIICIIPDATTTLALDRQGGHGKDYIRMNYDQV